MSSESAPRSQRRAKRKIDYVNDPLSALKVKKPRAPNKAYTVPVSRPVTLLVHDQVKAAVAALKSYHESLADQHPKSQLFEDTQVVGVMVSFQTAPGNRTRTAGVKLELPYPYLGDSGDVCLFVRDPASAWKNRIQGVRKVIDMAKLRGKYKEFKSRRQLLKRYALFLADGAIVSMLPSLLGSKFFIRKKIPMPIQMDKSLENIANQVALARRSTLFHVLGVASYIRVATIDQPSDHIVENVCKIVTQCCSLVPNNDRWQQIRSIHLKGISGPALPLFMRLPDVVPRLLGASPHIAGDNLKISSVKGNNNVSIKSDNSKKNASSKAIQKEDSEGSESYSEDTGESEHTFDSADDISRDDASSDSGAEETEDKVAEGSEVEEESEAPVVHPKVKSSHLTGPKKSTKAGARGLPGVERPPVRRNGKTPVPRPAAGAMKSKVAKRK